MINDGRLARVEGSHWVGEANFDDEVLGQFDFPNPFFLIDSTLRKARYTAGATTSIDGFLRIAAGLATVGIKHESLNLDWWGEAEPNPRELELVREVLAGGFGFVTNVYADTLLGNGSGAPPLVDPQAAVDLLADLGVRVMAPGIVPAPSASAEAVQMQQLADVVEYARGAGIEFTVTLAQAGRRELAALLRVANVAIGLGARRIDLMDSTSSLAPEAMKLFVRRFRAGLQSPVPVTMHAHDDFGLATAGAIAAATAGAAPDVSVNGISYRCGFAALEEVVVALELLYGVHTGIQVDRLLGLAELVNDEMGLPTANFKPLTGRYAFLKHTPNDVLTVLRDGPDPFPPISGCLSPAVVSAGNRWVWDSLSTPRMAAQLAANLGFELSRDDAVRLHAALDRAVTAKTEFPRWLDPSEAKEICCRTVAELHADVLP